MIDTHCHLTDPRLMTQVDDVLARAAGVGVNKVVTISTDLDDARFCLDVCRGRENVRCTVGIHPNNVAESHESDVAKLGGMLTDPAAVAIGEIGLDYHYDVDRARQRDFFVAQLDLAQQAQRPVVIHCREAVDDTLAVMKDFHLLRAIFHCFTGTEPEANRILAAGYWLGYTGVITYKNADEQRRAVVATPIDRLLVETDAPYLSPEPMRKQKINEPALVIHTARQAAKLKGIPYDEFDAITTANALRFYDWA
jgi:TatD DNase family protein